MPQSKNPKEIKAFRLSAEAIRMVEELAEQSGTSEGQIVEMAIQDYYRLKHGWLEFLNQQEKAK